jgi:proline iminopeptidase
MANTDLNYGLSEKTINILKSVFAQFSSIEKVIIYGSRAKGNYREGSDIDFAISAPNMSDNEFSRLWNALDDLPLIYKIDCLHLEKLQNPTLKENIYKQGIVFY